MTVMSAVSVPKTIGHMDFPDGHNPQGENWSNLSHLIGPSRFFFVSPFIYSREWEVALQNLSRRPKTPRFLSSHFAGPLLYVCYPGQSLSLIPPSAFHLVDNSSLLWSFCLDSLCSSHIQSFPGSLTTWCSCFNAFIANISSGVFLRNFRATDIFFFSTVAHIFLLLYMPGNSLLDVTQCRLSG